MAPNRPLGAVHAAALVVASMVGTGVFTITGELLRVAAVAGAGAGGVGGLGPARAVRRGRVRRAGNDDAARGRRIRVSVARVRSGDRIHIGLGRADRRVRGPDRGRGARVRELRARGRAGAAATGGGGGVDRRPHGGPHDRRAVRRPRASRPGGPGGGGDRRVRRGGAGDGPPGAGESGRDGSRGPLRTRGELRRVRRCVRGRAGAGVLRVFGLERRRVHRRARFAIPRGRCRARWCWGRGW